MGFWKRKFGEFEMNLGAENGRYVVSSPAFKGRIPLEDTRVLSGIVGSFAAGIANGTHIAHNKMHASFTETEGGMTHSSLSVSNVCLGNQSNGAEIHDLETVSKSRAKLKERQARDIEFAENAIRHLAKLLSRGEKAFKGELKAGFTSKRSKELYEYGIKVFEWLRAQAK